MPADNTAFTKKDFDLFYEISSAVHSLLNLDDMLRSILHKLRAAFRIEGASIALHDPGSREFYFIKTLESEVDGNPHTMKQMRFPDHLGVAGWVLRNSQSVIIADVSRDDRYFGGFDLIEHHVTRNMICVPLRTRKGIIGILYVLNKLHGEFTDKELQFLDVLSGTIAIAIENAKLYGELEQHASTLERENIRLKSEVAARYNFQGIISTSAAMHNVFKLMDKVLDTPTTVLIQGETGTGKELIAKAIHYNGVRKDKPFIAENCGALAENLLESELFGHVKGAFTGAIADKKGIFELADGGTVFLDEIEEMSPAMQVKLLRVLQERQLRPVGGTGTRQFDVRLIASSNRDIEAEVRKGNFRKDLYYRINVFQINLPPLRDRLDDIPLLADHFIRKYAATYNREAPRLSADAHSALIYYDWPGNVRELENEIERALAVCNTKKSITIDHLSDRFQNDTAKTLAIGKDISTLPEMITRIERQMIISAMRQTAGNRTQAARKLGITRQGLLNKIRRHRLKV